MPSPRIAEPLIEHSVDARFLFLYTPALGEAKRLQMQGAGEERSEPY